MIKNERQYRITRSKADEVRNTIAELATADLPDGLAPEMRALQTEALTSVLADLEQELAEYDSLHDATLIEATGLEQLPLALIRARIARGLTQRQLAERTGLAEQAIQRYEANNYAGVSFSRLVKIAWALDATVHYDVRLSETGCQRGPDGLLRDWQALNGRTRRVHTRPDPSCQRMPHQPGSVPRSVNGPPR